MGRFNASETERTARSPWYLGIDIGTTALSTSLLNAETEQQSAIAWVKNTPQGPLSLAAIPSGLHSFKPYLNSAIPYFSPTTQQWEPLMLRSPDQHIPLIQIQHSLTTLLRTLRSPDVRVGCIDDQSFQAALQHLAGVVVNQPVGASDAYRFNIREAVLAAELVHQPEDIFFIEEVVAALLAELPPPNTAIPVGATSQSTTALSGGVIVISAGSTTTELALTQVPQAGVNLTRAEVQQRRLPYAGNAIDQDIICQLIYPLKGDWNDLSLGNLDVPLPGEPDLEARYALQQQLEASIHGQKLLNTVRKIKPSLCQHDVEAIADYPKTALKHRDFYSWVLSPYLQQLNRELNLLLSQSGMTANKIQRVVCTGGTGSIPAIAQWLQQKFSQAQIVQDAPNSNSADFASNRIARGLALLPRFPQLLDRMRHQYSDYFLLQELLKVPIQTSEALSASQILQRLEQQGINVAACKSTLVNFLNGQLPTGLVPSKAMLLTTKSSQNAEYQALTAAPLFTRHDHHYRLNHQQRDRLWHHLQIILAQTQQTLEAPLTIELNDISIG
ncbi:hypothetical protein JOY44_08320 [Phormidium sp. CLA17]|uniref:hypothetical protein n=1 Tax=Leptolyngbya sp. Cla-17 TaxID=2803751 RepID=UPI001490F7FE|nr:hypothetical protein [Leptolyngbya sp. Cla-17]MBM0741619.1 hypothetical protein [Leptolyngbya sp. Cla-17]